MHIPIRVLLIGDGERFWQAARALLWSTAGVQVIGEASDGQAGIHLAGRFQPDVILIDNDILKGDPHWIFAQLSGLSPACKTILLCDTDRDELVFDGVKSGARGILIKGKSTPEEVLKAVQAVCRGEAVISPQALGRILDEMNG